MGIIRVNPMVSQEELDCFVNHIPTALHHLTCFAVTLPEIVMESWKFLTWPDEHVRQTGDWPNIPMPCLAGRLLESATKTPVPSHSSCVMGAEQVRLSSRSRLRASHQSPVPQCGSVQHRASEQGPCGTDVVLLHGEHGTWSGEALRTSAERRSAPAPAARTNEAMTKELLGGLKRKGSVALAPLNISNHGSLESFV